MASILLDVFDYLNSLKPDDYTRLRDCIDKVNIEVIVLSKGHSNPDKAGVRIHGPIADVQRICKLVKTADIGKIVYIREIGENDRAKALVTLPQNPSAFPLSMISVLFLDSLTLALLSAQLNQHSIIVPKLSMKVQSPITNGAGSLVKSSDVIDNIVNKF